jgi:(p)ppGpp synthase/HD superfamily hydrolase
MDILAVLEQFGLPVAMLCAFGYYIWRQNLWIQNDLTKDLHTKFNNIHSVVDSDLRMILIKLIDQQKIMQLDLKKIETSQMTMERITVDIIGKLMDKDSGNGFKKKLEKFLKDN